MNEDPQIARYLREMRTALRLPSSAGRRAMEEISGHLDDGVAAHMGRGESRSQAITSALDELGPAEETAARFNDNHVPVATTTRLTGWIPLLLPLPMLVVASSLLLWSLTWFLGDGDMSVGRADAQRTYFRTVLISGGLSYAAYASIKRARIDAAWRWGAWSCAALALLLLAI